MSVLEDDTSLEVDGEDDVTSAFLKRFNGEDGDEAGGKVADEAHADAQEVDEAPETTESTEDTQEATEALQELLAGDEHLVSIKVGDEEQKVSVKELRELYGLRSDVEARSAKANETLERLNHEAEKSDAILGEMLNRARAKFAPYAQADFALAAQRLDEGSYKQYRADAQEAFDNLRFLEQEAQNYVAVFQANRTRAASDAMAKCDEALAADPDTKGWDAKARTEIVTYAVAQGLPKAIAENLSDPAAVKLLRKAMAYDAGMKAVQAGMKAVAATAPKTPMRPGARTSASDQATNKGRAAMERLNKSGSIDDAASAFLARFGG